jgi:hypothetical protein
MLASIADPTMNRTTSRDSPSPWTGIEDGHSETGQRDEQASGNEDAPSDPVPTGPAAPE